MKRREALNFAFNTLARLFVLFTVLKRIISFPRWVKFAVSGLAFFAAAAYIVFIVVDHIKNKKNSTGSENNRDPVVEKPNKFAKVKQVIDFISVICIILFIPAWKGQLPVAGTVAVSAVFIICMILRIIISIINFRTSRDKEKEAENDLN